MKYNFPLILRIISILSTGTIFFSFIITNLCTNVKSPNFIEYTSLSKFFINFYIFVILLLCLLYLIYYLLLFLINKKIIKVYYDLNKNK